MRPEKQALREEARARRASLRQSQPDFAPQIARFADEVAAFNAGAIGGYLPLRDEADPQRLMERLTKLGRIVAVPCVAGRRRPLVFHRWSPGEPTILNAYGILEPAERAEAIVPATVLVPLLAFDSSGHRLGYGGGYYDRTLERLRHDGDVIAIGIAYGAQELHELPRATHDHALDLILTEHGLRKFDK
jgi:5-formyltetrahydrofolate cyclo-ligase